MMPKSILVTGSSGTLGTAIRSIVRAEDRPIELLTPTSKELDVSDAGSVSRYAEGRSFDSIVHLAAMTDLEDCHENPQEAIKVNGMGTRNLAQLAKDRKASLVYISTDAVFPGDGQKEGYCETDMPHSPTTVYGMSKLLGEWFIANLVKPASLIVRIGWIFGPNPSKDRKFVGAILNQLAQNVEKISAVNDKFGTPTFALHAARKIIDYAENGTLGIRHVANEGAASRFEVAKKIVELWGSSAEVEEVSSDHYASAVERPDYSVIRSVHADERLPKWEEALEEYRNLYPKISDFR